MREPRYHPLIPDDDDLVPLFFADSAKAVANNDFYLLEIVSHHYRLVSKNAVSDMAARSFRIHCPLCGAAMKPVSSGVDEHNHALYRCNACERNHQS